MIDLHFRPLVQRALVDTVAVHFARLGINANYITLLALILGLAGALCFTQHLSWLGLLFLWASGYMDMLDGSVARLSDASPVGAVFDIMTDRLVEALVIISLFILHPYEGLLCLSMLASVLLCVTSFLVVGIFSDNQSNKSFHYSPGLMERAEAFIFFSLMILLPQYFTGLGWLFIGLVLLTAVIRIFEFKRAFR